MSATTNKPARRSRARGDNALPVQPLMVDRATAAAMLAVSERTWEELVRQGLAPQPRQLSANRVGWLVRELQEFAEARPASQLLPPRNTAHKPGAERATN